MRYYLYEKYVMQWRKWKEMARGTSYALLNLRQWGRYFIIAFLLFSIEQKIYSQNLDSSKLIEYWNYPYSKTPLNDSLPLRCKIFRIKEIDNAYIIDLREETKRFKYTAISIKSGKQGFKKIKRGKWYEFLLFAYYSFDRFGGGTHTVSYTIDGVRVVFENDLKTGKIVTTPNLQGLYYIPPR